MIKKILVLCMTIGLIIVSKSEVIKAEEKNYREAESTSYNGILPDGTNINDSYINLPTITPRLTLLATYQNGARLTNKAVIYKHAYIYGTSVTYVKGAEPSYTLTVNKSVTKSHEFAISATAKFDIKVVSTEVKGSYLFSNTATVSRGETWNCSFSSPGTYNLEWYMRAHKYDVWGNCLITSTDLNNGTVIDYYLGTITFPTDEVHLNIY